ncbi:hypothetical protein [Methylobacterium sp. 88A]|uniref:hypothetical protein n=1 Tax=Methylobacterium sp. 88A TaxID=1131813 RepID=UPI0018DEE20A|nr:hypothetical protein [Methylobacterium sp. 88A]
MNTKDDFERMLVEGADALNAAFPDLFDAMIAAGRGPTEAELEMFRRVMGTGSDNEFRKLFACHANMKGSTLLANHLPSNS